MTDTMRCSIACVGVLNFESQQSWQSIFMILEIKKLETGLLHFAVLNYCTSCQYAFKTGCKIKYAFCSVTDDMFVIMCHLIIFVYGWMDEWIDA